MLISVIQANSLNNPNYRLLLSLHHVLCYKNSKAWDKQLLSKQMMLLIGKSLINTILWGQISKLSCHCNFFSDIFSSLFAWEKNLPVSWAAITFLKACFKPYSLIIHWHFSGKFLETSSIFIWPLINCSSRN